MVGGACDLGAFQVEGLGVVAQQHHVLLQVAHAAVLVVAHTVLSTEKQTSVRGGWVGRLGGGGGVLEP